MEKTLAQRTGAYFVKIGIHNGSGLGDILMSLPILYGLKAQGHEVYGVGNESTRGLYDFLVGEKIIAGAKIYQTHSPVSWRREIRDLDQLILVGYFGFGLNPLGLFRLTLPFARLFLHFFQNIKDVRFMETVWVGTSSSKFTTMISRPLSYVGCLEKSFGIAFNPEHIYFEERVLEKARARAEKILSERGLTSRQYAVLYPATSRAEKNMPPVLFKKILEYCLNQGLGIILIGEPAHGDSLSLPDSRVIDLRGRRDFEELVGLLALSQVVFSIDGGLLHLALASRAKTVSFWGATIPDFLVFPNHPYHHPLCRYLAFQPYEGKPVSEARRAEAFDFSADEIARAAKSLGSSSESSVSRGVGIIILNYCGWADTLGCLESLRGMDYPNFQIVVCDNGSVDDSWERLIGWAKGKKINFICLSQQEAELGGPKNARGADFVFVRIPENKGYAAGCNAGLRYFLGRPELNYAWLLNNDVCVDSQALTHLVRRLEEKPRAGLCGSTVVYQEFPDLIQAYGGMRLNRWWGTGIQIGFGEKKTVPLPSPEAIERNLSAIYGASVLARKKFVEEVGLMSERYFIYYEEFDWAMRARGRYELAYAPKSLIFHKEGRTTGGNRLNPEKRTAFADYYQIRNRIAFMRRFFPGFLPTVYCGILVAALRRFRLGQSRRVFMILKILLGFDSPPKFPFAP